MVRALGFQSLPIPNREVRPDGPKLAAHQPITEKLGVKVYSTGPYRAWQKGAVEHANKLIRQYISKGVSFKNYSEKEIEMIQHNLNRRPREKLEYNSPKNEFFKKFFVNLHLLIDSTLDRSLLLFSENYRNVLTTCLIKNISIIGNCLSLRSNLETVLRDYCRGKYDIVIDSVYSGQDLLPFLERSFKSASRFGKVVYKYND